MERILSKKAKKIKVVLLDVDGVLTDGELLYSETGEALKRFSTRDGLGITLLRKIGIVLGIVSGRDSNIVAYRAKELAINHLYQGVSDKLKVVTSLIEELRLNWDQVAYMGDDLIDIEVLKKVGLSACPCDAIDQVINICDFVSAKPGGKGAVREFADLVLQNFEN